MKGRRRLLLPFLHDLPVPLHNLASFFLGNKRNRMVQCNHGTTDQRHYDLSCQARIPKRGLMNTMKKGRIRKRWFLITLQLLLVFAIAGQLLVDRIGQKSEHGQFYSYQSFLPYMWITIAVTGAAALLVYLAVRFFPVRNKGMKALAWVLGIALSAWMLYCINLFIDKVNDSSGDAYGAAGLWVAYVDRLAEERMVWDKSHWFGHGDDAYEYSYEEFVEARGHLSLAHEVEEPYTSIVDERYKLANVFEYFYSDTLLGVLSYFYGKWVWLLYSLLAAGAVILAVSLLPLVGFLPGKLFYLIGCVLFAMMVLLPALNGCALVFDPIAGPIFTGSGRYYCEYALLYVGPTLGVLLGLPRRVKGTILEGNAKESKGEERKREERKGEESKGEESKGKERS